MLDQHDVLAVVGVALVASAAYVAWGAAAMLATIGLAVLIVAVIGAWRASANRAGSASGKAGQGDKGTR